MPVLIHPLHDLVIRKQGWEDWWGEVNPIDFEEEAPEQQWVCIFEGILHRLRQLPLHTHLRRCINRICLLGFLVCFQGDFTEKEASKAFLATSPD